MSKQAMPAFTVASNPADSECATTRPLIVREVIEPFSVRTRDLTETREIEACDGCNEEVRYVGEDGLSFCDNCGLVEGYTHSEEVSE